MQYKNLFLFAVLLIVSIGINELRSQSVQIKDTELKSLHSNIVDADYAINVFLPKSYHHSKKKYPVVFILDAEYNFGAVSYITRRLIKDQLISEVILIGIAYDTNYQTYTNNRQRDYTQSKTRLPYTGGGKSFLQFIKKELLPFIASNYKISNDRTIVGHSLGGSIGYYSLLTDNTTFNRYLLVSPSLWYHDYSIFKTLKSADQNNRNLNSKIYTAIGSLETIADGLNHDMVLDLERFLEQLKAIDCDDIQTKLEILDNETHRTVFPRAFSNGMRFLFGK